MIRKINKIKAQLNAPFCIPDFLNKNYLPSLDGWRAVAIILVILGHAKLTVSEGSFYYQFVETFIYAELGVRIFFVLSGFLITTLLIKEHINKGRINIKRFFIRRTLRIVPVLYLYLAVILLLNHFLNLGLSSDNFLGSILYINNFGFFQGTWLTGHTWSLAVEEQFYLIWPFVFTFLRERIWLFCFIMIFSIPIFKVFWYYNPSLWDITLGPFISNADAIFSGSLLAILAFKNFFNMNQKIWNKKGIDILFVSAIFISLYCVHRGYFGWLFYPCSSTICNIMICLLILRTTVCSRTLLYKFLNLKPIIKVGIISYSLYIWQQLFLIKINGYENKLNFINFPLNIMVIFGVSYLSFNYYEKFFLKLKRSV